MKAHIMRMAPQDWHSSPLRAELALERDHLSRMVYLELLLKLHENGGRIKKTDVPGAVLVSPKEAERAIARLLRSERLAEDDGWITNPRVVRDLARDAQYRSEQAQHVKKGRVAPGYPGATISQPKPAPLPEPNPTPKASANAVAQPDGAPEVRKSYIRAVWSEWCQRLGKDPNVTSSSAEYDITRKWFDCGIPLATVLRAMEDCKPETKGARSLMYLVPALEEACETRRKALA